jgi:tetratricopeptide (TPR) repeat protein
MRSDYCAGRHLLRHLGDARALRRNPLASRWIAPRAGDPDALASVGGAVRRALAAMDGEVTVRRLRTARHTVILLRMDVGAEAAGAVATDLGLSERQLRRERRLAHARFLATFRSLEPGSARVRERTADLQIDHASRLADSGEATSALAILEDVARRAGESTARCRALVRAADVEMELHRLDSAKTRLSDARRLILDGVVPTEAQPRLATEHRAAALQRRWYETGPAIVGTSLEPADDAADPRLGMLRVCAALRGGDGSGARRLLARVRDSVDRLPDAGLRIDALLLDAELADFLDGDVQRAEETFARVIEVAGEAGYGGRRLWATHLLAFTRWLHSPSNATRAAYRALVDRVDGALPEQQRLMLYFSAADIESAVGSPRRALAAAGNALRLATNPYESASAQALCASALFRSGKTDAAARLAEETATLGRSIGYQRVVATAQRIAAETALARGDRRAAREAIEESLASAAGRTSLYVLAKTYAVAARITRDPRYRLRARELRVACL